jgi:GH15 family glucan-1,4-alpha-glucosidase
LGTDAARGYRPIRDYALIGDAHTGALVASDGSVDWCCWPRFDSPAVFCRLLDAGKGGFFQVRPARDFEVTRAYSGPTAVLSTTFGNDEGRVRLTDFMPVERLTEGHRGEDIASGQSILRLLEGLSGSVEVDVSLRPTFDYARARADITLREGGAAARSGGETLLLSCPAPLTVDDAGTIRGRLRVSEGERVWITLRHHSDPARAEAELPRPDGERELERTNEYWRGWWSDCRYEGPYRDLVRRSALTLKLLTYEPTGALVAAPTTSLPEEVGGVRNWDYRYTWLRDSSLILYALQLLGYEEEAADFFGWLDKLCITCRGHRLQIMYGVDGNPHLPELTLGHLEGYRGSRPVRTGNAAFDQMQLDVCGEVLDAAHLYHERTRLPIRAEWWDELCFMADETARRWGEPDHGIWEVRGGKRHFLHSKLMCWVALDRAVRLAGRLGADTDGWARARDDIRRAILAEGYDEGVGAFTQSFGGRALDASALMIPLTGFLPAGDPRVVSTIARIRERLTSGGLVYRYLTEDGLPGGEATFAMCSFWLADNLALQGRVEEARELFERVAGYASDTGLFAEQIDPASGELLGNYPQGFTHLALIRSALHIARAEEKGPEEHAATSADRAAKVERAESVSGTDGEGS